MKSHAMSEYAIPPIVISAVVGVVVLTKDLSPLFGLAVALTIFVMLTWLGFCHTMLSGVGLRLVAIEKRLNIQLQRKKSGGFSFHSWHLGQGLECLPGLMVYTLLLGLTVLGILTAALIHFWQTMTTWQWSPWIKVTAILVLVALNLAAVTNYAIVERGTKRKKKIILQGVITG